MLFNRFISKLAGRKEHRGTGELQRGHAGELGSSLPGQEIRRKTAVIWKMPFHHSTARLALAKTFLEKRGVIKPASFIPEGLCKVFAHQQSARARGKAAQPPSVGVWEAQPML